MSEETKRIALSIPAAGDAIIDTDVEVLSLTLLQDRKEHPERGLDYLNILSLFSLAEAIVLNERLLVEQRGEALKSPHPIVDLVKKGIAVYIQPIQDYKMNVPSEYCKYLWQEIKDDLETLTEIWPGADYTLSASLDRACWAAEKGIDHVSWPMFGILARGAILQPVQSMMRKTYADLKQALESRVCELQGVGCPIPMYIPPVAAWILERCDRNAGRFLDEAIVLRDEFQGFRQKYLEYQRLIANPAAGDMSLAELFEVYRDAVSDVSKQLQHVSQKRTDSKLIFEMWDALCESTGIGGLGNPAVTASLNLGTVLSKGIKGVKIHRIRARARMLFDLWTKVLQIRNYGELVTHTFKIDSNELFKMTERAERLALKCNSLAGVRRDQVWGQP